METHVLMTPVEVLDWFHSLGFTVYDVRRSRLFGENSHEQYCYTMETSQGTGERLLREVRGKTINCAAVTVRRDLREMRASQPGDQPLRRRRLQPLPSDAERLPFIKD